MPIRPIPRYKLLPNGLDNIVDSDPETLRKGNGAPNVAAIARAADINKSALNRVVTGKRPWAGYGTVQRVSCVVAKARDISVEEAQRLIFEPVEDAVAA